SSRAMRRSTSISSSAKPNRKRAERERKRSDVEDFMRSISKVFIAPIVAILLFSIIGISGNQEGKDKPAASSIPTFGNRAIVGKIGDLPVHMVLDYYQGDISGGYHYLNSNPSVGNWTT